MAFFISGLKNKLKSHYQILETLKRSDAFKSEYVIEKSDLESTLKIFKNNVYKILKEILSTHYDDYIYNEKYHLDFLDYLYNYLFYPSIYQKMITSK